MTARSYLYVPGNKPEKIEKAAGRGADALILDLEDAVPAQDKETARAAVADWLRTQDGTGGEIWVRVNSGAMMEKDVAALVPVPNFSGVYLPKAASADDVVRLDVLLGESDLRVVALIETASGVLEMREIAAAPRIAHLAIGEADLAVELRIDPSPDGREFAALRTQIVVVSAAAGIDPPVASVSTDFTDLDALRLTTEAFRRMGFGGRAAIHPAQVPVINDVFTPSEEDVRAAEEILAGFDAAGGAAFTGPDGRMVDEPVVKAARQVLERARRTS